MSLFLTKILVTCLKKKWYIVKKQKLNFTFKIFTDVYILYIIHIHYSTRLMIIYKSKSAVVVSNKKLKMYKYYICDIRICIYFRAPISFDPI